MNSYCKAHVVPTGMNPANSLPSTFPILVISCVAIITSFLKLRKSPSVVAELKDSNCPGNDS